MSYYTNSEFSVKIVHKKISLPPKGIFGLAIECNTCAYIKQARSTIYFFRVESDAMEFIDLLLLHCVNIDPK
jgi:hypothetical protein